MACIADNGYSKENRRHGSWLTNPFSLLYFEDFVVAFYALFSSLTYIKRVLYVHACVCMCMYVCMCMHAFVCECLYVCVNV